MKSMDEYAAELDRRIDEKNKSIRKRRRVLIAACSALAVCLCAFGVWRIAAGRTIKRVELIPGKTVELAVDRSDRFVKGRPGYSIGASGNNEPDRMSVSGLIGFERGDEILFSMIENGPIYTVGDGKVGHILGVLPAGAWFGAAYYDGGVYAPATSEVICGMIRSNGVSRYDIETKETECVIASNDEVSSIVAVGNNLVYAANGERTAAIKLCDLSTGRIYKLAELSFSGSPEESPDPAQVVRCGGGLAVLYGGRVSMLSFDGKIKTVREGAEAISADENRLFVFEGVTNDRGSGEETIGVRFSTAERVEVYSAGSFEKLSEFRAEGYTLCCGAAGFTVHGGSLVAVKDGCLFLADPVGGETKKLLDGTKGYVGALSLGEKLLVLADPGYEEETGEDYHGWDFTGDVYLIGGDGSMISGGLPKGLSSRRDEKLLFDSIDAAKAALLTEPTDLPFAFEMLENAEIFGWESVRTTYFSGERREKTTGFIGIEAEYGGKRISISIEQEPAEPLLGFGIKLGYGDDLEMRLLTAEELGELPLTEGEARFDLIRKDGVPVGILSWIEWEEGRTTDVSLRLLCETEACRTVIHVYSEELSESEARELIRF